MPNKSPLSASELGSLWLTYIEKSLIIAVLQYLIKNADDKQAKKIMEDLLVNLKEQMSKITDIFKEEGAMTPIGITHQDVNLEAPKLFDKGMDILIVRILKEISMGLYTLSVNMSYREDVVRIYKDLTAITQNCYNECTQYLLDKGLLIRPHSISMPKTAEMIENKGYLNGLNPFGQKRVLNSIEVSYIHHAIESNNIGLQIITGFAQCATNEAVKRYFRKGMKLSEKIIKDYEKFLMDDNIPFSNANGGIVTESTVSPFSDKLMMIFIYFLITFSIGSKSFGSIFSMRNDLNLKFILTGKEVYFYGREGVKIMIKNGWLEEAPQMSDRNKLTT